MHSQKSLYSYCSSESFNMASFEEGAFPTQKFNEWLSAWRVGSEDWADGSLKWQFHTVNFDKWHYPYFCGVCKRGEICGVSLQRCNGCKVAHYCSREHQQKAWPIHKQICKHIANFFESFDSSAIKTMPEWRKFLVVDSNILRSMALPKEPLSDTMISDEWLYQRHCHACFYNPAARDVPARQLIECPKCHCAAHCSNPECIAQFNALHTPEACENYIIGFAAVVMSMQQGTMLVINSLSRATTFSLPKDWNDYFTQKLQDFEVDYRLCSMPPVMAMLTDGLSISMTLLRSLELVYGAKELSKMSRIEVHMLGAEEAEINCCAAKYEEVMHWLPNCKELVIVLVIGNNKLYTNIHQALEQMPSKLPLCGSCERQKASVSLRTIPGLYHELAASGKLSPSTATIVMACHSGIHDECGSGINPNNLTASWEPTVRMLTNTTIPCVFTGYNAHEIVRDKKKLVEWGAQIIEDERVNPFRGLRPFPEVGEDNRFYYSNHSSIITRGKSV